MSKHTPMRQYGTTVRFGGGGFDVRNCPDAEALAATIVRAVNSHEQLVEALQEAKALLELNGVDIEDVADYGNGVAGDIMARIAVALAAAEA